MINQNEIITREVPIYYLPKLKWYQKILQKLHIKDYYIKTTTTIKTMEWKQL